MTRNRQEKRVCDAKNTIIHNYTKLHTKKNIHTTRHAVKRLCHCYIESAEGERFKYPYKHLNGARAMARHVSEGGNPFDSFGKHIIGLSEELSKLRSFKTYINRSNVMAEGLKEYQSIVDERIDTIKNECQKLQRATAYKETFENFKV